MDQHNNISDEWLLSELKNRIEEKQRSIEEMNKLTQQLLEVNEKLAEAESLKSHFLSNITNEIVNPFTSIIGLAESIATASPEQWGNVKTMSELIYSEAFSLHYQLKNIFAAAAIEAGEVFPEPSNVSICNIIATVVASYKHQASKKKLEIVVNNLTNVCEKSFSFKTDAEKLEVIVANLLNNAINYSEPSNKIEITLNTVGTTLVVEVKDSGIGIAKEDHQIIFDRFKRLNTTINSVTSGQGLGLSVVKAYIELLDGTIEVKNPDDGKGVIFTVTLPESEAGVDLDSFSSDGNEMFFSDTDEMF